MRSGLTFYGLLYISDEIRAASPNIDSKEARREPVAVYGENAVSLHASLAQIGIAFVLLTNDAQRVRAAIAHCPGASGMAVEEIACDTVVPPDLRFAAAHHKFDAFRHFARQGPDSYSVLIDLDVRAIRPLPSWFIGLAEAGTPAFFDISENIFRYHSRARVVGDMGLLLPGALDGFQWAGGEFLAGPAAFYSMLVKRIDELYGNYLQQAARLCHVSDEPLASAAIHDFKRGGGIIENVRGRGMICRFWSGEPRYRQDSFATACENALLHLPSDKSLLARLGREDAIDAEEFLRQYRRHLLSKAPRNLVKRARNITLDMLGMGTPQ